MTDDLLVHHVELSHLKNETFYVITLGDGVMDDDPAIPALRVELGPTDMFESRAAEYGIDPDSEGGWDDILHLVLAPQGDVGPIDEQMAHPDHLFNAPTIEHAREAKLRQIRKAMGTRKLRGVTGVSEHRVLVNEATRMMTSEAEDPIEFIKRTAPMSREHMIVKQEFVRRHRNLVRVRRLGLDPGRAYTPVELEQHEKRRAMKKDPARESPDQLAVRLLGTSMDDIRGDRLPPRFGTPSKFL
jgi:hypothetical protein